MLQLGEIARPLSKAQRQQMFVAQRVDGATQYLSECPVVIRVMQRGEEL